jgi:hypothetical protein
MVVRPIVQPIRLIPNLGCKSIDRQAQDWSADLTEELGNVSDAEIRGRRLKRLCAPSDTVYRDRFFATGSEGVIVRFTIAC